MIQYSIFPNGKRRIVTFSYDDGHEEKDTRLVELFNKYKVKGTFHLNISELTESEKIIKKRELYKGHEISCHTAHHGWPAAMPLQSLIDEVIKNRLVLEKITESPVVGMSYPFGFYNSDIISVMRATGIVYSRTVNSTFGFTLPDNFLEWHPTCHHKDALPLCDKFMSSLDLTWSAPLLYIWGHSHEFNSEEDWAVMIKILEKISENEKIWYATNYEIYEYLTAQKSLVISADETVFHNPSAIDVWVEKDKKQIIYIPAGKTVTI